MFIQQSVFTALFLLKDASDPELVHSALQHFQKNRPKDLHTAGSYVRALIYVRNGSPAMEDLRIPRFRSCGHEPSHALLPDALIPYSSYSIRFILTVLYQYLHRTCTVEQLCSHWQISTSTLYHWIHLLETHASIWERSLKQLRKLDLEMLSSILSIPAFPSLFFHRHRFPFLQACRHPLPDISPPP